MGHFGLVGSEISLGSHLYPHFGHSNFAPPFRAYLVVSGVGGRDLNRISPCLHFGQVISTCYPSSSLRRGGNRWLTARRIQELRHHLRGYPINNLLPHSNPMKIRILFHDMCGVVRIGLRGDDAFTFCGNLVCPASIRACPPVVTESR